MPRYGYGGGYGWAPYVPVAERRRRAARKMAALKKRGVNVEPVVIEGRKIATTPWGIAWCDHIESFSDFENRLPRGRTYVRNGSVCHLQISEGRVDAKVMGSELYSVKVEIDTLSRAQWNRLKRRAAGKIGSLIELLRGKLSDEVMDIMAHRKTGLFPLPSEISFDCSCPDWASMCKHVAAVLYGIGARFDSKPELLFALRGVDHEELISDEMQLEVPSAASQSKRLADADLADVFGIDLTPTADDAPPRSPRKKKAAKKKSGSRNSPQSATAKPSVNRTAKKGPAKKKGGKKAPVGKSAKKKAAGKAVKKTAKKKGAARKKSRIKQRS